MKFKGYGLIDEVAEIAMKKTFTYVRDKHTYYNDAGAAVLILELQKLLDVYEKVKQYTVSDDTTRDDAICELLKVYEAMIEERYQFFAFYDEAVKEKAIEDMKKIEEAEAKEKLEKAKAELAEMEEKVKSLEEVQE